MSAATKVRGICRVARAGAWVVALACATGCVVGTAEDDGTSEEAVDTSHFSNPVIRMYDRPAGVRHDEGVPGEPSEGCPDPQGLRTSSGDFFIYCTSYTWRFSRLNGFPVFKSASRTLAGPWKPVGSIIADVDDSRKGWPRWIKDANGQRDGDFWGPDVHELPNGKFAASYSAPCGEHRCVGIAWANGPDGPWTHAEEPFITPANNGAGGGDSYDPNLLVTSSGDAYFYWVVPGRGVYVDAVDYDGDGRLSIKPGAKPTLIADRARGQRGEGPYVVEHDGGYYEFYSTGSLLFDYHVGVRRGDAPDAPFTTEGPDVVHRNGHFVATGGNSVIQDAVGGQDVLVYHAIVVPRGGGCPRRDPVYREELHSTADDPHCRLQGDRQAMIDPLVWKHGADGFEWPALANGKGTPTVGKGRLP